uniref:Mutator family transposase n=1 Tax=Anaerolinea thermolimosa TaxID=229919 RepID=A0A7C4PJQ0_9CHLR
MTYTDTYTDDCTLPVELLEQIASQGFDVLPELIRVIINPAMQAEWQKCLRAAPFQHTPDSQCHANGYKPKTVKTRLGEITFDIPQVREGGFYPEALEKALRSERALRLAEMYVQGCFDLQSGCHHRAVMRNGDILHAGQLVGSPPG